MRRFVTSLIIAVSAVLSLVEFAPAQLVMAPYEGLVATRGSMPNILNSTNRQVMARSPHYSRVRICSLKIAVPNFMVQTVSPYAEIGSGSAATVTASVEYPIGTMTQILFSGVAQGSVPDASYLVSDSVAVPGCIPPDKLFAIRMYMTSTTGVFNYSAYSLGATGTTGIEQGVSGITDKTMSGSVTQSSTNLAPLAIIGTTDKPSFAILGDSIGQGQGDTNTDRLGDFGIVMRSVGPLGGYMNLTRSGDQADKIVASHTNRAALLTYASHMILEDGTNDIYTLGATDAALRLDVAAVWGYMTGLGGGRKAYQTTILPRATSSDGWITRGNQSTTNGHDKKITFNAWLRTMPAGLSGYFELADVIEGGRDLGTWAPGPTANYFTADGTHPNTAGYQKVWYSGAINLFGQFGKGVLLPAAGPSTAATAYSTSKGWLTTAAGPQP